MSNRLPAGLNTWKRREMLVGPRLTLFKIFGKPRVPEENLKYAYDG